MYSGGSGFPLWSTRAFMSPQIKRPQWYHMVLDTGVQVSHKEKHSFHWPYILCVEAAGGGADRETSISRMPKTYRCKNKNAPYNDWSGSAQLCCELLCGALRCAAIGQGVSDRPWKATGSRCSSCLKTRRHEAPQKRTFSERVIFKAFVYTTTLESLGRGYSRVVAKIGRLERTEHNQIHFIRDTWRVNS